MNFNESKDIVFDVILRSIKDKVDLTLDTKLIGGESGLDSMSLIEVCLALEEIAEEHGFEFDWTSENMMSKSRSMFRTVTSLTEEFSNQSKNQK